MDLGVVGLAVVIVYAEVVVVVRVAFIAHQVVVEIFLSNVHDPGAVVLPVHHSITVDVSRYAVSNPVLVRVRKVLVNQAVAVIVQRVALLVDGSFQWIALVLEPPQAVRYGVVAQSKPASRCPQVLIHKAIAVVVRTVANLLLRALQRVTLVRRSVEARGRAVEAKPLAARDRPQSLVDLQVTVVVNAVAHLRNRTSKGVANLDARIQAVGYRMFTGPDSAGGLAQVLVSLPITIIVQAVANLARSTVERIADLHDTVGTKGNAVRTDSLTANVKAQVFINLTVAVVVEAVALLFLGPLKRHAGQG